MNKDINTTIEITQHLNKNIQTLSDGLMVAIYNKFPILGKSLFQITYAQYLLAISAFLFIIILRPILVNLLISIFSKITKATKTNLDDLVLKEIVNPLKFSFTLLGLYLLIYILNINQYIISNILNSLAIYVFFWFIISIVTGLQSALYKFMSKINKELSNEFTKFLIRIIKIVIIVIGLSSILSIWGINVTALIASLGIGGLAFALAAKDTAANLFGSIAILVDKSIKLGDWVVVDGIEGVVEDIGMRTTKIRTFQKSITAIPNSIVANSHIENFSRRDIRRLKFTIGLTYSTKKEDIETIVTSIKELLKNHDGIAKDQTLLVNFESFGDSSLNIFIYCFTNTADWKEYLDIKEDINYKIIEIVKSNNSDFAFPSQSIYVESLPS